MALFTDGGISSIEDLLAYESEILGVATVEDIDLTVKLELAAEELGIELSAYLARRRLTVSLGQIVVTEPLHKWHTFQSLALAYRDAYHRQMNDRYRGKWHEYEKLARWAWQALLDTGIGVTNDPIARAAKPELGSETGAAAPAGYFVRVSWRSDRGEEGAPSAIAAMTTASGQVMTVRAVDAPSNAIGWNVYAGTSAMEQRLQNDVVLAIGTAWTMPASGPQPGTPAGTGQAPQYYLRPARVFERG